MKKTFAVILVILLVIVAMVSITIKAKQDDEKALKKINSEYQQYLGKKVYGTDVTTVINRAIENNTQHNIQKDEKGMYIDDGEYCIKVELNMITVEKTYQMEQLYNAGLTEFVKNFNLIDFECSKIEYHKKTGRVSKIVFNELEEEIS